MNNNFIQNVLEFSNISKLIFEASGATLWADKGYDVYNNYLFEQEDVILASGRLPRKKSKEALDADLRIGYVAYHWRKNKVIYSFSDTFLSLLDKTDDTEIYSNILKRLPFTDFAVNLPENDKYDAMLVHIEFSRPEKTLFLLFPFMINKALTQVGFSHCMCWCVDGQKLVENYRNIRAQHGVEFSRDKENYLRIAVAAAYYLASKNAEIKETTLPKNKRLTVVAKPGAKPKKVNVKTFDVGYVIGKSFEQQMRSANATCAESFSHCGSSHSVRPHVRRAHWHHYWVGEGRTRLEVRWIEPTLVLANSKNEADVAIVRSVKGA